MAGPRDLTKLTAEQMNNDFALLEENILNLQAFNKKANEKEIEAYNHLEDALAAISQFNNESANLSTDSLIKKARETMQNALGHLVSVSDNISNEIKEARDNIVWHPENIHRAVKELREQGVRVEITDKRGRPLEKEKLLKIKPLVDQLKKEEFKIANLNEFVGTYRVDLDQFKEQEKKRITTSSEKKSVEPANEHIDEPKQSYSTVTPLEEGELTVLEAEEMRQARDRERRELDQEHKGDIKFDESRNIIVPPESPKEEIEEDELHVISKEEQQEAARSKDAVDFGNRTLMDRATKMSISDIQGATDLRQISQIMQNWIDHAKEYQDVRVREAIFKGSAKEVRNYLIDLKPTLMRTNDWVRAANNTLNDLKKLTNDRVTKGLKAILPVIKNQIEIIRANEAGQKHSSSAEAMSRLNAASPPPTIRGTPANAAEAAANQKLKAPSGDLPNIRKDQDERAKKIMRTYNEREQDPTVRARTVRSRGALSTDNDTPAASATPTVRGPGRKGPG